MSTKKTKNGEPRFAHWTTVVDGKAGTSRFTRQGAYETATGEVLHERGRVGDPNETVGDRLEAQLIMQEQSWHQHGRPYFKLWPAIADALATTKLQFSAEYFATPFPAFAVMLPSTFGDIRTFFVWSQLRPVRTDGMGPVEALEERLAGLPEHVRGHFEPLLKKCRADQAVMDERVAKYGPVRIALSFAWTDSAGALILSNVTVHENMTMDDAVQQMLEWNYTDTGEPVDFSRELREKAARIAIATAMFGVNKHELVAPDLDVEAIRQRFPAGRSAPSKQCAAANVAREVAKCKGFRVGEEIDLPRPRYERGDSQEGTGRELQFGHVRSCHMRMQPCGPGGQDRKLIFVWPARIRKDLPLPPSRGFRIRDPQPAGAKA